MLFGLCFKTRKGRKGLIERRRQINLNATLHLGPLIQSWFPARNNAWPSSNRWPMLEF